MEQQYCVCPRLGSWCALVQVGLLSSQLLVIVSTSSCFHSPEFSEPVGTWCMLWPPKKHHGLWDWLITSLILDRRSPSTCVNGVLEARNKSALPKKPEVLWLWPEPEAGWSQRLPKLGVLTDPVQGRLLSRLISGCSAAGCIRVLSFRSRPWMGATKPGQKGQVKAPGQALGASCHTQAGQPLNRL